MLCHAVIVILPNERKTMFEFVDDIEEFRECVYAYAKKHIRKSNPGSKISSGDVADFAKANDGIFLLEENEGRKIKLVQKYLKPNIGYIFTTASTVIDTLLTFEFIDVANTINGGEGNEDEDENSDGDTSYDSDASDVDKMRC